MGAAKTNQHRRDALPPLRRLLVFNSHEAWVYQLGALDVDLDIVVGLKGRHVAEWDTHMRPVPRRARLVTLPQLRRSRERYDCIIAHSLTDLLDVKDRPGPRLVIMHTTLEGRVREEHSQVTATQMSDLLARYTQMIGAHAISVSALKAASWGLHDYVPFAPDPEGYRQHQGDVAAGLRICNLVTKRRQILLWDLHERAFAGLPVRIVGHNPDLPGVRAAADWDELKLLMAQHRFYIHTAVPGLEDGYNMATLEAMAAGLPVLGNKHASSPVEHGKSGFLSDDAEELRGYAQQLLNDADLAARMGRAARQRVAEKFSPQTFCQGMLQAIATARLKFCSRPPMKT